MTYFWHIYLPLSVTLCLCSFNDNFGLFRPSSDNLTLRYKQLRAPKHQLPLAVTASNDRLQNQLVQRLNIQYTVFNCSGVSQVCGLLCMPPAQYTTNWNLSRPLITGFYVTYTPVLHYVKSFFFNWTQVCWVCLNQLTSEYLAISRMFLTQPICYPR